MDDQITHLLAADARTDPATPRVPVSDILEAGALQLTAADGLRTMTLLLMRWDTAFPFGEGLPDGSVLASPIGADSTFYVPVGFTARIYLITGVRGTASGDITEIAIVPILTGTGANISSSFESLDMSAVPSLAAEPLAPPYEINGDDLDNNKLSIHCATDGLSGAVAVLVCVYGYMIRNA